MLTLELARRGVKTLAVDRLPKPSETSNAITVHARSLEIFERIDKRLAERFLERGIHNAGYVLHASAAPGAAPASSWKCPAPLIYRTHPQAQGRISGRWTFSIFSAVSTFSYFICRSASSARCSCSSGSRAKRSTATSRLHRHSFGGRWL
jgi:hypothetical protein